ncbi:MAG: DUF3795 domain-containing protein [Clostridia bacterium]|nr:DUF3795 domain-containing protein [Clostridia bacterium]
MEIIKGKCGTDCSTCSFKDKFSCKGCLEQKGKIFWGECDIYSCASGKEYAHCGMCDQMPCAKLTEFIENGHNPDRLSNLKKWRAQIVDSRCGLHCIGCEYKETNGCKGCIETNGHPFHGECPVAVCCQDKGITHCGECPEIPCALLTQYSCDPVHGDHPQGARIEQCKKWKAENA